MDDDSITAADNLVVLDGRNDVVTTEKLSTLVIATNNIASRLDAITLIVSFC